MLGKPFLICTMASVLCMAQSPRKPNVEAERTAMSKLQFLVGTWSGEARIWQGPSTSVELIQTELVTYKLDGLLLMVEGVGKSKSDGKATLQAFGIISYDDAAGVYRMRAFNDGRWLESDVQLDESGKALDWGFTLGQIKTKSTLRMNENGDWTEVHEVTVGSEPSRKFMEVTVKRRM
jgi:Protein of unknown function (DUF1579)